LLIFGGCVKKDVVKAQSQEEGLRERVLTYWHLKEKQEFDKSYEYEDPYYRKITNLVTYIQSMNTTVIKWKSAKIKGIEMDNDEAKVELVLDTEVKLPGFKEAEHEGTVKEKWVQIEGKWYHVPEKWRRMHEKRK
jgi:hypothetical protein